MAVSVTGWPKFGMGCILSDVGGCIRLAIAVFPACGEKIGLIALLCQASHFPVFDWLLTSLKCLTQSANILSIATKVYLPCQCGVAPGFFLPRNIARAFGLLALDANAYGHPPYVLIGPPRECAGESCDPPVTGWVKKFTNKFKKHEGTKTNEKRSKTLIMNHCLFQMSFSPTSFFRFTRFSADFTNL